MTMPPSNNMGAENTTALIPAVNRVLIDWFAWTLKTNDPHEAIKLSGLDCMDFTNTGGGGMGYKSSMRAGNIVVFYDGNEGMGCHISMTGKGCRFYETTYKKSNVWYALIHRLFSINATITRIDVALDNVDGSLDLSLLEQAVINDTVRTRFKGAQRIENFSFGSRKKQQGKTIYLGSRQSRFKVRFYDKAAEQGLSGHWVRCELQCMAERAQELARHLAKPKDNDLGALSVAALNHYFSVVDLDDINRSRCTPAAWWQTWLNTAEKLRLTTAKAIRLVDECMEYIRQQYSPTLAMIHRYLGDKTFRQYIADVVSTGSKRQTKKHEMIIQCSQLITELPF